MYLKIDRKELKLSLSATDQRECYRWSLIFILFEFPAIDLICRLLFCVEVAICEYILHNTCMTHKPVQGGGDNDNAITSWGEG